MQGNVSNELLFHQILTGELCTLTSILGNQKLKKLITHLLSNI